MVWYNGCMQLQRATFSDELDLFFMKEIMVDGIYSRNNREYGFQFYTVKPDYWDAEHRLEDEDGFINDEDDLIAWESPYAPVPLMYGEMDEELWLKEGIVCGKKEEESL